MDAWKRTSERKVVEAQRRRPRPASILIFPIAGAGELPAAGTEPPDQIHLEATRSTGEVAPWLDDLFWIDLIRRWQERPLAVHVLPTPYALLHPVVLHHVEMLRRVVPRWRRVGQAYVDDVLSDEDIARLAAAPYDEARIIDEPRPGLAKPAAELRGVSFTLLVGRVLRAQAATHAARPVLVRIPAPGVAPVSGPLLEAAGGVYTST